MRDLYAALDLERNADPEQIHARLATHADAALRAAVEQVLLRPERRAAYDRVHQAIEQIAMLRVSLGLEARGFARLRRYRLHAQAQAPAAATAERDDEPDARRAGWRVRFIEWLRRLARGSRR